VAAPAAATLSLVDHPRAHVDTDDVGALVEQPVGLRPGTASGVQHDSTLQAAGNQPSQGGSLQKPIERPFVGGGRPDCRQPVVGLTGSLRVLSLFIRDVRRHQPILVKASP
jgi:hypothetical protein